MQRIRWNQISLTFYPLYNPQHRNIVHSGATHGGESENLEPERESVSTKHDFAKDNGREQDNGQRCNGGSSNTDGGQQRSSGRNERPGGHGRGQCGPERGTGGGTLQLAEDLPLGQPDDQARMLNWNLVAPD